MSEQFDLFTPPIYVKKLEEGLKAAGLDFDWSIMDYEEYRDACPKCFADVGELCTRRGKNIDRHQARMNVAFLRFARGWVPKPGDKVYVGYGLHDPEDAVGRPAIFKSFTSKGEAELDDLGAGWTFKTLDAHCLWPADKIESLKRSS